jgi:catechol-2,3-dioxygenase
VLIAAYQVDALEITATMTNETTKEARETDVLHVFFQMDDGSSIAFFAEPSEPFDFAHQRDFDLHLALEVPIGKLHEMFERGKAAGIETRGISDHGFINSIYFRDPNGYVIELTTPIGDDPGNDPENRLLAREKLDKFQAKYGGKQAML